MRKKVGDTPMRRSTRLQQEKKEEQVSKEPQTSKGSSIADILQPRESIRAYRKHVVPTKDRPPSPPSSAVLASGPVTQKESGQAVLDGGSPLTPVVKLKRLDVFQEEAPSSQPDKEKELQDPNIKWEVVRDQRARLQVLDTPRPRITKMGPPAEEVATDLQGLRANVPHKQRARAEISTRSTVPAAERAAPSRLRTKPLPPRKQTKLARTELPDQEAPFSGCSPFRVQGSALKGRAVQYSAPWRGLYAMPPLEGRTCVAENEQRFLSPPALCSLLFLLVLAVACWLAWKHGSPVSFLGLMGHRPWTWNSFSRLWVATEECSTQCSMVLVESIPDSLDYETASLQHLSIYQAWMDLLAGANSSVEIAAFYFTLRDSDIHVQDPSSEQGREVFQSLLDLPSRGVSLSIAVNSGMLSTNDTEELVRQGADVRYVDMKRLTGGILHTKLWVVDEKHVYIGSANMDWRSLTQVKELGVVLYNCSCLARDVHRIFAMYRMLGKEGASIPTVWPADLAAESSLRQPLKLQLNDTSAELYISSSPPALCSEGRTSDINAIISVIEDAQDFIYISVMNYQPQCLYCNPERFWPVIDDALRAAACERNVSVRLLISCWRHSDDSMFIFLESLSILHRSPLSCPIEVKLFVVPIAGAEEPIPYTHVNHNKYMVTDRVAYVGTSNWSGDYFTRTAGVGLIVNQSEAAAEAPGSTLHGQLEEVFHRDWDSQHTWPLSHHWQCAKH